MPLHLPSPAAYVPRSMNSPLNLPLRLRSTLYISPPPLRLSRRLRPSQHELVQAYDEGAVVRLLRTPPREDDVLRLRARAHGGGEERVSLTVMHPLEEVI